MPKIESGPADENSIRVPEIRFVANLWTLTGYPSPDGEWSLEEKVSAIKDAGFDLSLIHI